MPAHHLLGTLSDETVLIPGDNQPYSGLRGIYTVDRHTYGSGPPACGFEIASDLLETANSRDRHD
ncbi:hypothetical protein D2T29_17010 [Sinirhodobacter populi]|uniref:Uncharacterized protein n=1 Tax=Paenirhodobacter populi TaxID=2306993 RepID=A0A443K6D1_9RHOB|nr:hypothetical protein [Sinirhodobacter populi]RWR28337.1 hypothetical protein D2T29_17010 [Sinirhodobacter populi]